MRTKMKRFSFRASTEEEQSIQIKVESFDGSRESIQIQILYNIIAAQKLGKWLRKSLTVTCCEAIIESLSDQILSQPLMEGYRARREEDAEINREWESTMLEGESW